MERPVTARLERGRQAITALVNHWLGRTSWTHYELPHVAAWGLGEAGLLNNTDISRLRNAKQVRGASLKNLQALAAANRAAWLWLVEGKEAAIAQLGPPSSWRVTPQVLEQACWLPHPDRSDEPLGFTDLCEVQAGLLPLPYLATTALSPADVLTLNRELGLLLGELVANQPPREAVRTILDAYPVRDTNRRNRLEELVLGRGGLTREEWETELEALVQAVLDLRGADPTGYGPAQLLSELKARPRSF